MLHKLSKLMLILVLSLLVSALALMPAPVAAQAGAAPNQTQWVSFTVGRVPDQFDAYVTIYMTGGSFVVSGTPNPQYGQTAFGASSATPAGTAQTWGGSLVPGAYFVGVQGDPSTLSISGQGVSYARPAPSTPVVAEPAPVVAAPAPVVAAPAPVVTQPAQTTMASQIPAATPNQPQWVSFTVGRVAGEFNSHVTIMLKDGSFVVSNTPSMQPAQVQVHDPDTGLHKWETGPSYFGASCENTNCDAQTWSGDLVPGTYFVGVHGDASALIIYGQAVSYSAPAPSTPVVAAPAPVVTQPAQTSIASQAPAATPGQPQWVSFTVGRVAGEYNSNVSISLHGAALSCPTPPAWSRPRHRSMTPTPGCTNGKPRPATLAPAAKTRRVTPTSGPAIWCRAPISSVCTAIRAL